MSDAGVYYCRYSDYGGKHEGHVMAMPPNWNGCPWKCLISKALTLWLSKKFSAGSGDKPKFIDVSATNMSGFAGLTSPTHVGVSCIGALFQPMDTHRRIRVLLVDHDYIARCGVAVALQREADIEVVRQAKDESRACLCPDDSLDVILFGAHTDSHSLDASFHDARSLSRHARVVVYGGDHTEEHVHHAVGAGAFGYLCRHSKRSVFVDAVRRVASGHRYFPDEIQALLHARRVRKELSAREVTMLELIAEGLSNKEMAAHLQVSPETVKFHVGNLLEKLEARDRAHALVIALRRGIMRLAAKPVEEGRAPTGQV